MNKLWNSIITSLARLLLGFCLVVGLSALTAGLVGTAHADSPIVITTCDEATLGNAFYNAPSGATIEFACSGSIQDLGELFPRPGTSLTLDASGQQVTIEGNGVEPVMTVSGGHLTLINLTIADGYGYDDFHGGGLNTIGADVTIRNSTFLHNAGREGGAIAMEGGSLSISNSTFANNSAPFGGGVGLYSTSAASITNSTFVGNSGGAIQAESNVSMSGSIVANNTPKNCFHAVIDQGYNLESGTDCDFSASTDLQNTDPKLAPLSDNGGSAQRLALLDGSPAINHGGSSCPAIDQRGITRPQGPACDIGAFEFRVPTLNVPSRPIMVDATSSQGASVTYAVTAGLPDDTSSSPALKCVPASGSTFLIGTTTVNCTASDQAQPPDTTSGSFQVVIKGAAAQISDLTDLVNSFGLPGGLQTSLDAKLQDALAAVNAGNTATACSDLTDFIGAAQAQAGKKLTQSQAQQVVAATQQIQAVLGC